MSRYSPPCLTATQLLSISEFMAYSGVDLHHSDVTPSRAYDPAVFAAGIRQGGFFTKSSDSKIIVQEKTKIHKKIFELADLQPEAILVPNSWGI